MKYLPLPQCFVAVKDMNFDQMMLQAKGREPSPGDKEIGGVEGACFLGVLVD